MNLQIDVGNTFVKWRVLDIDGLVARGRERTSINVSLGEVGVWNEVTSVYISSVASKDVNDCLRRLLSEVVPTIIPIFAKSESSFCGVLNAYKDPSQLGVDRWMAVIAGYLKYRESCFVVDCGSAITIDLINDSGEHQGGYILPGIELMKLSLSSGTNRVRFNGVGDVEAKYGETTSECVQAGISFVLRSVLEGLRVRMREEGVKRLIVTGGDGVYAGSLCQAVEYSPDLVFDGLTLLNRGGCVAGL